MNFLPFSFLSLGFPSHPKKPGLLNPPPSFRGYGGPNMTSPRTQMRGPPGAVAGGCVIMVYGLDADKMNCDRLFNLLCCYGNVLRVS